MKNPSPTPFNPKNELFHWGPIPGQWLYVSRWAQMSTKDFPEKYGGQAWPTALFLLRDGRMAYVSEDKALREVGKKWFLKLVLPQEHYHQEKSAYDTALKKLLAVQKHIEETEVGATSDKQLIKLWDDLHEAYGNFWLPTHAPEAGNYGAEILLKEKLGPYIKNSEELSSALQTLTTVEELSFYQQEEIELAETNDVATHQRKYLWLKNSYAGSQTLPVEFFAERKRSLTPHLREEFNQKLTQVRLKKQQVQKQYNLPPEIMEIAERTSEAAAWQDDRKKYIFITIHYEDVLLKEIERRTSYSHDELMQADYKEIVQIVKGADLHTELQARQKGFGIELARGKAFSPQETIELWERYAEEKVKTQQDFVKGMVVSKGEGGKTIRGKVRILLDPHNIEVFEDGEILVAPMTSPEYVFAMKKATAVVTDAGGLTSHAAIVSRELHKPCVVGTKVATKVFQNGDQVEVDANKGIVKKL